MHTMVKQGSQRSCKVRDRVPTSDQVKDGVTEFTRGQTGRARSCEVMDGVLEVIVGQTRGWKGQGRSDMGW